MCFSASASFIAGTALSAIGVATLRNTRTKSEIPFAVIPLLFGIQQLTEGVIWLTFRYEAPLLKHIVTHMYAVFAYVLWPMYAPFALAILERERWRKRVLFGFLAAGIFVGLYLLYAIVARPIVAQVTGRHIVYFTSHFDLPIVKVLYLAATCVSCFFSSHRFIRLFGVLALLSFLAAYVVHSRALVSIWCFFAAILSLLIYIHFRYRRLGGFPANAPVLRSSVV